MLQNAIAVPADNRFGQLAFQSPEETLFADLKLEHSEHYAPFTLSYARCARTHSETVGGARGSRRARSGGESRKIRLTHVKRLHEMCGASAGKSGSTMAVMSDDARSLLVTVLAPMLPLLPATVDICCCQLQPWRVVEGSACCRSRSEGSSLVRLLSCQ